MSQSFMPSKGGTIACQTETVRMPEGEVKESPLHFTSSQHLHVVLVLENAVSGIKRYMAMSILNKFTDRK